MIDITTIPINELERDLRDSRDDIGVCETALLHGITSYSGGSVKRRLEDNKFFVKVISAESERRSEDRPTNAPSGLATESNDRKAPIRGAGGQTATRLD